MDGSVAHPTFMQETSGNGFILGNKRWKSAASTHLLKCLVLAVKAAPLKTT